MRMSILLLTGSIVVMSSEAAGQGAVQRSISPSSDAAKTIPVSEPMSCDYNTCALQMKLSWGNWLILRGEEEKRVEKLGMFRTARVQSLVSTSPEAVSEARVFEKNYMPGEVWPAVGALIMIVSVASADRDVSAVVPVAGLLGGSALLFYGVSRSVRAINALHKTIWLYNRSLQR